VLVSEKPEGKVELTESDLSVLGNVLNIVFSALGKIVSAFSEKEAESSLLPSVVSTLEEYRGEKTESVILAQLSCTTGLSGNVFLVLQEADGVKLAELAQQQELSGNASVDEMGQDVLKEIFNQVSGEVMSNITASAGREAGGSIAQFKITKLEDEAESLSALFADGTVVRGGADLNISDVSAPIQVDCITSTDFVSQVVSFFGGTQSDKEMEPQSTAEPGENIEEKIPVESVHFDSLSAEDKQGNIKNIDLLLDVPLKASIELGRTDLTIQEILNLGGGSVVELDKLASEPIDFLVNGKIIAQGEVVVIDDKFGVRITNIVSPRERLESV